MYGTGMRIPFLRYVMNHLHLFVTNNYSFVCTITLLLPTTCLTLAIANIFSDTTLTSIIIIGQISTSPMDLFLHTK